MDPSCCATEAYIEFVAPQHRYEGRACWSGQFPNCLCCGLSQGLRVAAGLRIGYGFASPRTAALLGKMQLPFGTGHTSVVALGVGAYDAEHQCDPTHFCASPVAGHYLRPGACARWVVGCYCYDGARQLRVLPPRGWTCARYSNDTGLKARHSLTALLGSQAEAARSTKAGWPMANAAG